MPASHVSKLRGAFDHAHRASRGDVLRHLEELARAEKSSANSLEEEQLLRLDQLLVHAYRNVPHYRALFKSCGIAPHGKPDPYKFSQVPLLTRQDLMLDADGLKSDDLGSRRWFQNSSGGSTGEPVRFVQDKIMADWAGAVALLFHKWSGWQFGMRSLLLWGSERDLFVGKETARTRVARWLRNETWLNAFRMGPANLRSYVGIINTIAPGHIVAYADALYELARFAEREGMPVVQPTTVMTSAGTLYDEMRTTIERVFRAPVFNRYGTREMGGIASECSAHEGLHTSPLTHVVEVLREDGAPALPGETGELVVTSLTNFAMPLIRYRIGDTAIQGDATCSCGRKWPLLRKVLGRSTDVLVTARGGVVSSEYLIHLIGVVLNQGWVRLFQIVQEIPTKILVVIAPQSDVSLAEGQHVAAIREIRSKIQLVMGEECEVQFRFVDDIPASASGKRRVISSKLSGG